MQVKNGSGFVWVVWDCSEKVLQIQNKQTNRFPTPLIMDLYQRVKYIIWQCLGFVSASEELSSNSKHTNKSVPDTFNYGFVPKGQIYNLAMFGIC